MAIVIYQEEVSTNDRIFGSTITKDKTTSLDIDKLQVWPVNAVSNGDELHHKNKAGTIIFKGIVDGIEIAGNKFLTVKDFGFLLQNALINQIFNNVSPESIIQTIVESEGLTYSSTIVSGTIIPRQPFDDLRKWDAIVEMADLLKAEFRIDENKVLHLELRGQIGSGKLITQTTGAIDGKWKEDPSTIINTAVVVSDRQFFEPASELFSGTGSAQELTLTEKPNIVKVENPIGTVLDGQVTGSNVGDYTVDRDNKKVAGTFTSGTDNIEVFYDFSIPIKIKRRNKVSIDTYGKREKRFEKQTYKSRAEARAFGDFIVNRRKDPSLSSAWFINDYSAFTSYIPNQTVNVDDTIESINEVFVIDKVVRTFPGKLKVFVGEDLDALYDWQKEVQNRVKTLETKDDNQDELTEDEVVDENLETTLTVSITEVLRRYDQIEI